MASVRFTNPATIAKPFGYSHIAEITGGRLVYMSGQVAVDPEGNLVGEGDFEAQARQVFENLTAGLAAVGSGWENVAKMNVYTTENGQIAAFRAVRDDFVDTANPPASTYAGVAFLALPEYLVEIEVVAVVPEG